MRNENSIKKMKYIFGSLFLLAQRWQYIGDRYLAKDNLTTKQWLLLATIVNFFDSPPTLSQAAKVMGSSRQNVKQIAMKLQKRGLLEISVDEKDTRILRLKVTEKSHRFWGSRTDQDEEYVSQLFDVLSDKEIKAFYEIMQKLERHTEKLLVG